jgi:hypothetical protein
MRPLLLAQEHKTTPRAVYRFFRDTGPAGVEILLLALADQLATGLGASQQAQWRDLLTLTARMLGDFWHRRGERVSPPLLISGADLKREFGLQPGPLIGELLQEVLEAQVSGEVHSVEDALALVRTRLGR